VLIASGSSSKPASADDVRGHWQSILDSRLSGAAVRIAVAVADRLRDPMQVEAAVLYSKQAEEKKIMNYKLGFENT